MRQHLRGSIVILAANFCARASAGVRLQPSCGPFDGFCPRVAAEQTNQLQYGAAAPLSVGIPTTPVAMNDQTTMPVKAQIITFDGRTNIGKQGARDLDRPALQPSNPWARANVPLAAVLKLPRFRGHQTIWVRAAAGSGRP